MNRDTGEIRHMAKEEMDALNKSFFEKELEKAKDVTIDMPGEIYAGLGEKKEGAPTETAIQESSVATTVDKKPLWFDVGAMLHQGRVIQIDDTMWEIRRADIKPGTSGRVALKLKYRGHA